jgi:uncharacterized protein (DUF3820 family)
MTTLGDGEEPTHARLHYTGQDAGAWHDGVGWYYVDTEYPEDGSCGAFPTAEEAIRHAGTGGYILSIRPEDIGVGAPSLSDQAKAMQARGQSAAEAEVDKHLSAGYSVYGRSAEGPVRISLDEDGSRQSALMVDFGKHRGKLVEDLPGEYMKWLISESFKPANPHGRAVKQTVMDLVSKRDAIWG